MTELHLIGGAFVVMAIAGSILGVLLKREIVSAWADTLDGCAKDLR